VGRHRRRRDAVAHRAASRTGGLEDTEAGFKLLEARAELDDGGVGIVELALQGRHLHALAAARLLRSDAVLNLATTLPVVEWGKRRAAQSRREEKKTNTKRYM